MSSAAARGFAFKQVPTTHLGHARDYVQELGARLYDYRGVIVVSGDGLIAEVIQGLARRPDADRALQVYSSPPPPQPQSLSTYLPSPSVSVGFVVRRPGHCRAENTAVTVAVAVAVVGADHADTKSPAPPAAADRPAAGWLRQRSVQINYGVTQHFTRKTL